MRVPNATTLAKTRCAAKASDQESSARLIVITIGVISDTHGLLRPEAAELLRGSEHIIHAGDIGSPEIIPALERIAPVTAIRGNIDTQAWTRRFPETEVAELAGLHIYVIHDLNALDLDPKAAGFAAVISGHSHQPKQDIKDGVLYFNPGSAGPRRFTLPISVGKLEIVDGMINATILNL
jgi:putative phosphoesterase